MSHEPLSNIEQPQYWEDRYQSGNTPWDMNSGSPPLLRFVEQQVSKDARILLPGAGKAHEAVIWWQQGYKQLYVCDFAPSAFDVLRKKAPDFPEDQMLIDDFFSLKGQFDYIIEQTFFCAIPPEKRPEYVRHTATLLCTNGTLAGLLFDTQFDKDGPPYGGSIEEYEDLFSVHYHIEHLELSPHSIKPRLGRELFIQARPRNELCY